MAGSSAGHDPPRPMSLLPLEASSINVNLSIVSEKNDNAVSTEPNSTGNPFQQKLQNEFSLPSDIEMPLQMSKVMLHFLSLIGIIQKDASCILVAVALTYFSFRGHCHSKKANQE
jgi:hypothetical protein